STTPTRTSSSPALSIGERYSARRGAHQRGVRARLRATPFKVSAREITLPRGWEVADGVGCGGGAVPQAEPADGDDTPDAAAGAGGAVARRAVRPARRAAVRPVAAVLDGRGSTGLGHVRVPAVDPRGGQSGGRHTPGVADGAVRQD